MKIKGKSKDWDILPCTNFFNRLKGNMGKKKIDTVLLFPKCNSIHTFFMKANIDVVMIDKENNVLYCYNNLSKWKIILPKRKVFATLEFPSGENIYQINDKVEYKKEI